MTVFCYTIMILAGIGMITAYRRYKKQQAASARPVAAVCGVIVVAAALGALFWPKGGKIDIEEHRGKEEQYRQIAYRRFGKHLAEKHAGSRALLLTEPVGENERDQSWHKITMEALKEGLGRKVEIIAQEKIGVLGPGARLMFTLEEFEDTLDAHAGYDLLISLAGLPPNYEEMALWQMEDEERPKVALANANIHELGEAIKAGYIVCVLHPNPGGYNPKEDVPADPKEAFKKRFLLITPQNVEGTAKKFPNLFKE